MTQRSGGTSITVMPAIDDDERLRQVIAGLTASPKRFPMKYLYMGAVDESRLFETIANMPDYHVAEAEERLLRGHVDHLVRELQPTELLDIGCGCGLRVDALLEAMNQAGSLRGYIGVDIARAELKRWVGTLSERYPQVEVRGIVGDLEKPETMLAIPRSKEPRLAVVLGQTLGNFSTPARVSVLRKLWSALNPGDPLIVGLDFTQDLDGALPGYDDADGRNAAFSLNALEEINRLLGTDLRHADFAFTVHADQAQRAIISSLVAKRELTITNPLTGDLIEFEAGEPVFTERSHRFDVEGLRADFGGAGFDLVKVFLDSPTGYGVAVAVPRAASQDRIYGVIAAREAEPALASV